MGLERTLARRRAQRNAKLARKGILPPGAYLMVEDARGDCWIGEDRIENARWADGPEGRRLIVEIE